MKILETEKSELKSQKTEAGQQRSPDYVGSPITKGSGVRRKLFLPIASPILLAAILGGVLVTGVGADPVPAPVSVKWSAADTAGGKVAVPAADRPSVVLFVRGDQPQSKQAIRQAKAILKNYDAAQAVVVLSGQQNGRTPAQAAESLGWTGPVVLDSDYAASGTMAVHVWPTTVVVAASGVQVAHLPGISGTYSNELDAYLAFASGKINRDTLMQKLKASEVVGDTAEQMAARHLQVAGRLLEKGFLEEAQGELAEGLKRQPRNAPLQVALARVLIRKGAAQDIKQAMEIDEKLDAASVPAWQRSLLKGEILVSRKQWDEALPAFQEALKLNPEPAEAQYELGRIYEQRGDMPHAAQAYKAAFEATPVGKGLAGTTPR